MNAIRIFVSAAGPAPHLAAEWEDIADMARHILEARKARDAIQVPKGAFENLLIEVREDKAAPPRPKIYTYSQSTGQLKT